MKYIDLHLHSNFSDGTLSPSEVVFRAADLGLSAIALTDHDTVSGVPEALSAALSMEPEDRITVIPGAEITAGYLGRDIHILGLFLDYRHPALNQALDETVRLRDLRNEKMAENLRQAGIPVTVEALREMEPRTVITRAHFARFMNSEYKAIPSSIIAEGLDIWNGAGDRGDAAMVAYGASRYALARGDKAEAEALWPLITWCLEYCHRKLNDAGVVASDSDELEGRFPSGEANLCTSSLYYDALLSAAYLGKSLGKSSTLIATYSKQAAALKKNIEAYFGGTVEGFDTYAYYKGNDVLRSWICIPLTVGIYDRKEGTIQALFSPRLWTENGLLTQAGSNTFWDRSTLYALRGVYACGETEKVPSGIPNSQERGRGLDTAALP